MTNVLLFLLTILVGLGTSTQVEAQTFISKTGAWEAYQNGAGNKRICYIASEPIKKRGKYKSRGDTFVLVTNRPAEKKLSIFELRAGYPYKKDSSVTIKIDSREFKLFTHQGSAWAKTSKLDQSLANAMIRGGVMTVTGISRKGNKTVDTYSLAGFTAAYKAIRKSCGVK